MTTAGTVREEGRRAGRSDEVGWLGRTRLVAQGAIYLLVALLASQVALFGGDSSRSPDKDGALRLVADQPAGRWLLGALAFGFAAYALWRFAQALVDRSGKGNDAKALAKRFGYLCVGAWYALLAVLATKTMLGSPGTSGDSRSGRPASSGCRSDASWSSPSRRVLRRGRLERLSRPERQAREAPAHGAAERNRTKDAACDRRRRPPRAAPSSR
jgi:hypothetical protein